MSRRPYRRPDQPPSEEDDVRPSQRAHDPHPLRGAPRIVATLLIAGAAAAQGGPVPLAEAWPTLEPPAVWRHFHDLTQVPRPSHHEERATALVAEFGRRLGLETLVDATGNVVLRKSATPGMEARAVVVLQAHLDMVPQKTPGSTHDFLTDPIRAFVADGWVSADGTTLGADDGIGVAIILALLESDDVAHGPLEALFTVSEEDGPMGIEALAPDALRGRIYINLDHEAEGQFLISSAGGVAVDAQDTYEEVATPPGTVTLRVTIDGLRGGHSGVDIHLGRGHAHQLMARLLTDAAASLDLRLAELIGGDVRNAIPRSATAVVTVPEHQAEAFGAFVDGFRATVAAALASADPAVAVTLEAVARPPAVVAAAAQRALIGALHAAPQGVLHMSRDVPGMVQTSSNLGVLRIGGGRFVALSLVRSALDAERDGEARRLAEVFERTGAVVTIYGAYPSWPPASDSPLLALMTRAYADLFGATPTIVAIHAGLETSTAGATFPGMDMISVGPTIQDAHSPDERLEVASVAKVFDLLVATLRQIEPRE
jgi:dipeptidase D